MRFFKSEAGAIVLWLVGALLGAALLMPVLYDAGKGLAESAKVNEYSPVVERLAYSADWAKPDRFFSRALLISGMVLVPVLVARVRRIPLRRDAGRYRLRRLGWVRGLVHCGSGMLIGVVCLGVLGGVLYASGAVIPTGAVIGGGDFFKKAVMPALGAGVIEELVFRGLILGLWLRACSLGVAWVGSAVMFSFVHFLKPAAGVEIGDPRAWYAGFEMLGSTLGTFRDPTFFVTEFLTLGLLGFMLAWCRTRTFALWLPIGLHAGLVLALKVFSLSGKIDVKSGLYPWLIGMDLKSGILPLVALGVCFGGCVVAVRWLGRWQGVGGR